MSLIARYADIYQLGYVSRDLDTAMDFLRTKLGVEDFVVAEHDLTVAVGGEQRPQSMRVAIANAGGKQVEVIQPVSGAVGLYEDGVDYRGGVLAFHHVGIAVPGAFTAWRALEDDLRASGDPTALAFAYDAGGEPQVRYTYIDTRAAFGHYTEYLWWAPQAAAGNAALPSLA